MSKQPIAHPDCPPSRAPYSAGILADGWLFVSGQGPIDQASGKIQGESIEDQVRLTLQNVESVLKAGGATLDDVVKCTCYLSDIADFKAFNRVYREFFKEPLPARTTTQAVLWGGMKVEIDAIARVGTK